MATRRPPIHSSSIVERKRSGLKRVRKTVYFSPETTERLTVYAFEQGAEFSDLIEKALLEYLDHHAPIPSKRRTSRPPTSAPPATRKSSAPPRSRRT